MTLCSSIKQNKTPYLFDWEQGITLHSIQGNRGLIPERAASLIFFLDLWRETGLCIRVMAGVAMKNYVCTLTSGFLSSYDVHLRNINYA